ncbi:lytic transglycosylase domain-containing protein [Amycolatopsis antarctica]|uniref:lytic transglycosylase domain-containing protein n=1 Tax=Amycolatopsis antarctica TaxID=1854586 RepID=UPI00268BA3A4
MRFSLSPSAIGSAVRRFGTNHRVLVAGAAGLLAVLPAFAASGGAARWAETASTEYSANAALQSGVDPKLTQIGVNGSLPQAAKPEALPAYEIPEGTLGIPGTALDAYHNAAGILAAEQPACRIDWALIASIGRIESNHARGGFVDENGDTREPILGPVLDGAGPVAAIPDTDQGRFDGDTVWDRAVGPTQFIPSTWYGYASDGNGDGESNPNNIFDATLATGRYLCSGGMDMANPDQLRTAIFRYNNSDTYVNTVILWAQAYRSGVLPLPNSQVPVGAPNAQPEPLPAPGAVPQPPAPVTTPPPSSQDPAPGGPGSPTSGPDTTLPGSSSTTSPTTTESCVSEYPDPTETSTTTPPPTSTSELPPCDGVTSPPSPTPPSSDGSSSNSATRTGDPTT